MLHKLKRSLHRRIVSLLESELRMLASAVPASSSSKSHQSNSQRVHSDHRSGDGSRTSGHGERTSGGSEANIELPDIGNPRTQRREREWVLRERLVSQRILCMEAAVSGVSPSELMAVSEELGIMAEHMMTVGYVDEFLRCQVTEPGPVPAPVPCVFLFSSPGLGS